MLPLLTTVLFLHFDEVLTLPLQNRSPTINAHLPIFVPHQTHTVLASVVQHGLIKRRQKGHTIPVIPITHTYLIPKLHVIPAQSNVLHSSVHTDLQHYVTKDNLKIPVLTQTISQSSSNITHPTPITSFLVPIHNHIVQLQDLSVIPLQKVHKLDQKVAHYTMQMDNKEEEHEDQNRYRTFYGGYGTGLFFGGHGAGHGFYAYG